MLSQRGIEGSNPFSPRLTDHRRDYVTIIPKQAFCWRDGQVIVCVSETAAQGQKEELLFILGVTIEAWTDRVLSYCMYTFEVWGDVIPKV